MAEDDMNSTDRGCALPCETGLIPITGYHRQTVSKSSSSSCMDKTQTEPAGLDKCFLTPRRREARSHLPSSSWSTPSRQYSIKFSNPDYNHKDDSGIPAFHRRNPLNNVSAAEDDFAFDQKHGSSSPRLSKLLPPMDGENSWLFLPESILGNCTSTNRTAHRANNPRIYCFTPNPALSPSACPIDSNLTTDMTPKKRNVKLKTSSQMSFSSRNTSLQPETPTRSIPVKPVRDQHSESLSLPNVQSREIIKHCTQNQNQTQHRLKKQRPRIRLDNAQCPELTVTINQQARRLVDKVVADAIRSCSEKLPNDGKSSDNFHQLKHCQKFMSEEAEWLKHFISGDSTEKPTPDEIWDELEQDVDIERPRLAVYEPQHEDVDDVEQYVEQMDMWRREHRRQSLMKEHIMFETQVNDYGKEYFEVRKSQFSN